MTIEILFSVVHFFMKRFCYNYCQQVVVLFMFFQAINRLAISNCPVSIELATVKSVGRVNEHLNVLNFESTTKYATVIWKIHFYANFTAIDITISSLRLRF